MSLENEMRQDRKMTEDGLAAQNYMTGQYNIWTNRCSSSRVKMTFLNLLGEEHRIQNDLMGELLRRGWLELQQASPEEISELRSWAEKQKKK